MPAPATSSAALSPGTALVMNGPEEPPSPSKHFSISLMEARTPAKDAEDAPPLAASPRKRLRETTPPGPIVSPDGIAVEAAGAARAYEVWDLLEIFELIGEIEAAVADGA